MPQHSTGSDSCDGLKDKNEVAYQLCCLVKEIQEENRRDRRLVFALLAVMGIAVATVGGNLYAMIYQMSGDMRSMSYAMGRSDLDKERRLVEEESMKASMLAMRADMTKMAAVMGTMNTMGQDMRTMSGNMGTMTRDVSDMSMALGSMTNSVGLMSTMTPAVQRMSGDTASMGRDMHWMMPFNWMPFQ